MKNRINQKNHYREIELAISFGGLVLIGVFVFLAKITIISIFTLGAITLGSGSAITISILQLTDIGKRINDTLFRLKWWHSIFLSMILAIPLGIFSISLFLLINFWAASGPLKTIVLPIIERGKSRNGPFVKVDINKIKFYDHYIYEPKEMKARYLDLTLQKGFFGLWVVKKESARIFVLSKFL